MKTLFIEKKHNLNVKPSFVGYCVLLVLNTSTFETQFIYE